jgi:hypothetical protein
VSTSPPKWTLRKCPLESSSSIKQNPSPRPSDDVYEALEEQLATAIKEARAGDYDGDEFGSGFCTIYIYGPNADSLFTAVQPVLKKFHAPVGSYLIKRYGKPGAKQERVEISVNQTPQPK